MGYLVHTRRFEGPLGLLLYLIRKEEMDIFDINMVEITRQYLDYIKMMKELDLEIAGDFVAMAATLLYIKSRMLLPHYGEDGEVIDTEDPRKELVQQLLEYQRYQEAGKKLYDRPLLNRDVWQRSVRESLYDDSGEGEIVLEEDGLFSLISSYRRALRKMKRAVHHVRAKSQSIAGRIMEIKDRLIVGHRILLHSLVNETGAGFRNQLLITFLSTLELGRMGFVSVFQNETYGDIHIEALKPIENNVLERVQEFETEDAEAVAKSIFNQALEARADAIMDADDELRTDEHGAVPMGAGASGNFSGALTGWNAAAQEGESEVIEVASDDEILAAEADLGPEADMVVPPEADMV